MRTNIDFLGRATTLDAEERAQLIAETRLELDELTNLVSEMVELATDVRSEEPVEPVVLGDVANDVAARFRRRTGKEIVVDADDAGVVDGRQAMIDRAVSNLVDNALKFSPTAKRSRSPCAARPSRWPTVVPASTPRTATACSTASTAPPAPARCRAPASGCRSSRRSRRSTAAP